MRDFLERLALAIAPVVATELTRHALESRSMPAAVQPSGPAPSLATYVGRHRG